MIAATQPPAAPTITISEQMRKDDDDWSAEAQKNFVIYLLRGDPDDSVNVYQAAKELKLSVADVERHEKHVAGLRATLRALPSEDEWVRVWTDQQRQRRILSAVGRGEDSNVEREMIRRANIRVLALAEAELQQKVDRFAHHSKEAGRYKSYDGDSVTKAITKAIFEAEGFGAGGKMIPEQPKTLPAPVFKFSPDLVKAAEQLGAARSAREEEIAAIGAAMLPLSIRHAEALIKYEDTSAAHRAHRDALARREPPRETVERVYEDVPYRPSPVHQQPIVR